MTTIVSFLLVAVSFVLVGWPFFRAAQENDTPPEKPYGPLDRQKQEAYAAIREAEFDLHTGKLSAEDFAFLQEKYRRRAMAAMAALDKAQPPSTESPPRSGRASFCPECGARIPRGAKFCGGCGRALSHLSA